MNRLLSTILLTSIFLCFLSSCNNSETPKTSDEIKKKDIVIKEVKLDTFTCTKGGEIKIDGTEATLKIEFNEIYEELKVTVNNEEATVKGKVAIKKITGITETGKAIIIVASAKNCNNASFNFTVKKNQKKPEYEPITSIGLGKNNYKGSVELAKLEAGTEKIEVENKAEILVKVVMPKACYDEAGWKLEIAGEEVAKGAAFKESGTTTVTYTASKTVPLNKGTQKEIKVKFTNTSRNYTKEYKATVKHIVLNKIDFIRLIDVTDANNKTQVNNKVFDDFNLDSAKSYYKAKEAVSLQGTVEKCTFLMLGEDKTIAVRYAFKDKDTALPGDSDWQALTKKDVTYKGTIGNTTVNAYALEDKELKTGSEFLFVMLEKDGAKTYYCEEIKKMAILNNNAKRKSKNYVYQDENGIEVEKSSPLAKKGLIRVEPESPKATVKLLTPTQTGFVKKADGWHEYTINLTEAETSFSYEIIAEDGQTKTNYASTSEKFTILPAITKVEFAYKNNPGPGEKLLVANWDGKYHIALDKSKVDTTKNKIYFWLTTFKGVELECADFESIVTANNSHKFNVDVSTVIADQNGKKTCNATLKLNDKNAGSAIFEIFQITPEIIKSLKVCGVLAHQVSADKWVCKANINKNFDKTLKINLILAEGKTVADTKQIVEVYKDATKLDVVKDGSATDLIFTHENLEIQDKGKMTLTIKYWAEGNVTESPTKTFTLEIEDI